jgi:hypothetical protein
MGVAAILLLASAGTLSAQTMEVKAWADKMFHGVTTHDFGTVPRGTQLKYTFPIKNIWAVPLQIIEIRPSCGCVKAIPSTKTLQPHETATLDIAMDGTRFTGPKTVWVYVTVGPEYISTAALRITATTRADVVLNPGEINFGIVPRGQTPTQYVDVEYAGVLDWRITEVVKSSAAPIEVTPQELYRQSSRGVQAGKVGYRLTVALKGDAAAGVFKHELILKTNDPASPVLPVVVEGNVQASLTVSPDLARLGSVQVGQEKLLRVTVRGDRPFQIMAVEGQGDGLTAVWPTQPAQVHLLQLKYNPTQPGELRKQLLIRTDMVPSASVSLTVEGTSVQ